MQQHISMPTIIIAPGAFKNSLGAHEAANAIEAGLRDGGIQAEYIHAPIADGGNGTLDAFCAAAPYKRIAHRVSDPLGNDIDAEIGIHGDRAIIEMALASGLELCDQNNLQPMRATTFGTGQLIKAALDADAKKIIIGLGGSATVDGGMGCLQALGVQFFDKDNNPIADGAGGGDLIKVQRVDASQLDPRLQDIELIIACDVDNPVVGEQGSAEIFAPQKGADAAQVQTLAQGLNHFFEILSQNGFNDVRHEAGAGAAGSIAGALMCVCNGTLEGGFELWQQYSGFDNLVQGTDLLITGEGRMDEQTIHGKGPMGAALIAKQHGVPAAALVGGLDADDQLLHEHGIDVVLPLVTKPMPLDEAIQNAESLLRAAACRLAYALQVAWPS